MSGFFYVPGTGALDIQQLRRTLVLHRPGQRLDDVAQPVKAYFWGLHYVVVLLQPGYGIGNYGFNAQVNVVFSIIHRTGSFTPVRDLLLPGWGWLPVSKYRATVVFPWENQRNKKCSRPGVSCGR